MVLRYVVLEDVQRELGGARVRVVLRAGVVVDVVVVVVDVEGVVGAGEEGEEDAVVVVDVNVIRRTTATTRLDANTGAQPPVRQPRSRHVPPHTA